MEIRNDWDMYSVLSKVMVNVIRKVSKQVAEDLIYSIENNTYKFDYYPNVMYYNRTKEPTRQFEKAFHFDEIVNNLNQVFTELSYHWEEMDFDEKTFLHWSSDLGDTRERLAEILNINGMAGMKERQAYWDIFIEDEFSNGLLKQYFDDTMREEFAKIGAIVN